MAVASGGAEVRGRPTRWRGGDRRAPRGGPPGRAPVEKPPPRLSRTCRQPAPGPDLVLARCRDLGSGQRSSARQQGISYSAPEDPELMAPSCSRRRCRWRRGGQPRRVSSAGAGPPMRRDSIQASSSGRRTRILLPIWHAGRPSMSMIRFTVRRLTPSAPPHPACPATPHGFGPLGNINRGVSCHFNPRWLPVRARGASIGLLCGHEVVT
jgi:hypothetical protein